MQRLRVHMELERRRTQKEKRRKDQRIPPSQQYPWLLYFNGKNNQIFCSILDPTKTYTKIIPELKDAELWTIQHGWCLVANRAPTHYILFLWNPCTLQKIQLPSVTHYVGGVKYDCILSSSPTSTDQVCSIFLFSPYDNLISYFQLGDNHWMVADYSEYLDTAAATMAKLLSFYKSYLKNPVYCNGCLYAESFRGFLVVIEIHRHRGFEINSTYGLMPKLPPTGFHRICRLLASNNELFQIEILHTIDKIISVVVYKFEFALSMWEKVKSIKDRAFFVSNVDSPFACQTINSEIEGGYIYFTITNNNFVYIYNIEDKSLMLSQPFPNLPEKRSCSMWFMPNLRMRADILEVKRGKSKTREKESICGSIHLNEKRDTTTNDYELSLDVVGVIAKRLNIFDYLHFRATDKLFRLGAPPVQYNDISLLRFDDHSLCPLLAFLDKDNVFTFVHPKHGLKYKYTVKLPKLNFLGGNAYDDEYLNSDCEICYSKDGWILLTMNTNCSFFFNPFTKEVTPFKYGPITIRSAKCVGFSNCPNSYKCVIVDFESNPFNHITPIYRLIDDETRYDSSFNFQHGNFSLYNKSPTFHNGSFYYLSNKGMLGFINLREERSSWKEFKELQSPCTDSINSFLVECNGNILSVFEGTFGKWVRVFKLNELTMKWTKVQSLGNHMLFVGNTSFSAVANIPGMENKIYFPRFYGQSIVFYSLETKKYHTFEDEELNFESVREPLNSSWIEPKWH